MKTTLRTHSYETKKDQIRIAKSTTLYAVAIIVLLLAILYRSEIINHLLNVSSIFRDVKGHPFRIIQKLACIYTVIHMKNVNSQLAKIIKYRDLSYITLLTSPTYTYHRYAETSSYPILPQISAYLRNCLSYLGSCSPNL